MELEKKTMSLEILRNVIQLMITGMGQDWSVIPEFNTVMQKCGEHLGL